MTDDIKRSDAPYSLAGAWVDASAHLVSGAVRANSALLSLLNPGTSRDSGTESLTYTHESWTTDEELATPDEVTVGDRITFSKELAEEDVRAFAAASGDTNRLHLDDDYAEDTRFDGSIVHGSLVGGVISAALARLPGVVIYLSQDMAFLKPVEVGDEVSAVVEVVEGLGGGQYRLETTVVRSDGETVVGGEAVVLVEDSED